MQRSLSSLHQSNPKHPAGFALVASLSIMAVLVLIAVALYSLSSVATRSAEIASARAEAQANAKMALMMAIGELQSELGPDQRISANAAILDSETDTPDIDAVSHPHWLGVWDSWIAGDLANASVNPDYPSGTSEHQTLGDPADEDLSDQMHPKYDQKNDHFRRWLVSLNREIAAANPLNPNLPLTGVLEFNGDPTPGATSTGVRLVGESSLGPSAVDADFVNAQLIDIIGDVASVSGRYAWWVGDQSQKATIMADSYSSESSLTDADRIFRAQAPASMGTKAISELSQLTPEDEVQFDKVGASLEQLDLFSVDGSQVSGSPSKTFTFVDDAEQQHSFHHFTMNSLGVLADVREGGLKRDLSTLLERPIDINEDGDEFMLYAFDDPRFDDRSQSRVPIQDLAAYYQLYDDEPAFGNQRREGIRYDSDELPDSMQLNVPDYDGGSTDRERVLEEYTTLYRQPVITKVQFLVGLTAQEITAADRLDIQNQIDGITNVDGYHNVPIRADDTHRLRVGIMPMITLWNPNNVPLIMDSAQTLLINNPPPITLRWRKNSGAGDDFESNWFNLSFLASGGTQNYGFSSGFPLLQLTIAGEGADSVVFEPGEVKVFSVSAAEESLLGQGEGSMTLVAEGYKAEPGYDPFGFLLMRQSAPYSSSQTPPDVFLFTTAGGPGNPESNMVFNSSDSLSLFIDHDVGTGNWASGQVVGMKSDIKGAAFAFSLIDPGYREAGGSDNTGFGFLKHYSMVSRHGNPSDNSLKNAMASFNEQLMTPGFPGGVTPIDYEDPSEAIQGSALIGASSASEVIGMFEFSLSLGCEVGTASTGGFGGGRRVTSRPFLHSPVSAPPFIDQADKASLYNHGWDWQLSRVNNVEDSIIQADPGTDNGFFGGGYTVEAGTTYVIQREIPVLPTISIASLSNAHLGGFSLGRDALIGDDPNASLGKNRVAILEGTDHQKTTATGQGGLGPHIVQAIGNSYAHPNIPAASAFTTKTRHFDIDEGEVDDIPFVDHSYLANKAIWDEYFFSSIAPQPSKVPLFGSVNLTAKELADGFFFNNPNNQHLPNRRLKPYTVSFTQDDLDTLFTEVDTYTNGLADKIAGQLMVDGAFNINSTSIEAWKVFLYSMRGKPIAYFESGVELEEVQVIGTSLTSGILPNSAPIQSSEISSPKLPAEQWMTGRELTDVEISQLAEAIVKQVKLRGPFLSLSEFVNRRLDENDLDFSVKGALQAALDDDSVSINANFRTGARMIDEETTDIGGFDFPDAAKGPIAYGSTAYVDQADLLKHFSEQLTPRGDTFVIRTYGDSLDAGGDVIARTWCEAVVQRVPEYCDSLNLSHEKQADLTETNRSFGRKFKIISFRWLDSSEV